MRLAVSKYMETAAHPSGRCPQCGEPIFTGDTVCGFCGHVLTTQTNEQQAGAEPRIYKFSAGVLIACWVVFGLFSSGTSWGAYDSYSKGLTGATVMFVVMSVIFIGIAVFATVSWCNEKVVLYEDSVEWTSNLGNVGSCLYRDLTVTEKKGPKGAIFYRIGPDGGPFFDINSDISDFKALSLELMRKAEGTVIRLN